MGFERLSQALIYILTFFYMVFIDIPWYEGLYKVNEDGIIVNNKRCVMKSCKNKNGYLYNSLSNNKVERSHRVHRLVMLSFKWPSDLSINHKNWCKTDNRLDNLEYCTVKENIRHAWNTWLCKSPRHHFWKKLVPIVEVDQEGNDIKRYSSIRQASIDTWLRHWRIWLCCRNDIPNVKWRIFIKS